MVKLFGIVFGCHNEAKNFARLHGERHSCIMVKLASRSAVLMLFTKVQRVAIKNALKRQWTWTEDK